MGGAPEPDHTSWYGNAAGTAREHVRDAWYQTGIHLMAVIGLVVGVWVNVWDLTDLWESIIKPLDQLIQLYCVIASLVCLSVEGAHVFCCGKVHRGCILNWFPFLDR